MATLVIPLAVFVLSFTVLFFVLTGSGGGQVDGNSQKDEPEGSAFRYAPQGNPLGLYEGNDHSSGESQLNTEYIAESEYEDTDEAEEETINSGTEYTRTMDELFNALGNEIEASQSADTNIKYNPEENISHLITGNTEDPVKQFETGASGTLIITDEGTAGEEGVHDFYIDP